jgi:integrase
MLTEPKTEQSRRRIYIPRALCQELMEYRHRQGIARLEAGHWEHPDLVFTRKAGAFISPAYFSSYYARVRKRLGIETTFHMLRHDLASRMKDSKKFDLKDIQEQLGHSTINVTMDIYTHLNEDSKAAVGRWMQEDMGNVIDMDEKRQERESK